MADKKLDIMSDKYDVEKWALDNGASPNAARLLAKSDPNHLADHERAHGGTPGATVRHGQDATGKIPVK